MIYSVRTQQHIRSSASYSMGTFFGPFLDHPEANI